LINEISSGKDGSKKVNIAVKRDSKDKEKLVYAPS